LSLVFSLPTLPGNFLKESTQWPIIPIRADNSSKATTTSQANSRVVVTTLTSSARTPVRAVSSKVVSTRAIGRIKAIVTANEWLSSRVGAASRKGPLFFFHRELHGSHNELIPI
jgi:hypothetical protein